MTWTIFAWALVVVCLGLLAYTYVGYPVLAGFLAKVMSRPITKNDIEPTVSFVIAAHNEEEDIAQKLEGTLELDYPAEKLTILVASDGSTDRTDEIVESFADRGVKLFRTGEQLGKTETANRVVKTLDTEIVVFSDATGRFSKDAVRKLVANFADPRVGVVAGRVVYEFGDSATASGFKSYQAYAVSARRNEASFGTQTSVSGSIHAIRRELFKDAPGELSFDMVHPLHVAQEGYLAVYEPEATSMELSRETAGEEYRARVRLGIRAFSFLPYLLARMPGCKNRAYVFQMMSHKVSRWISPFLLLGLLLGSLLLAPTSKLALVLLLGQLSVYLGALIGRGGVLRKLTGAPLFFTTINLAFLVGFLRWAKGERLGAWKPER